MSEEATLEVPSETSVCSPKGSNEDRTDTQCIFPEDGMPLVEHSTHVKILHDDDYFLQSQMGLQDQEEEQTSSLEEDDIKDEISVNHSPMHDDAPLTHVDPHYLYTQPNLSASYRLGSEHQQRSNTNGGKSKGKTKRQYIVKNPNRPKRPLSAYNLFFRYERERLVREEMLREGKLDVGTVEELIAIKDKTKTGKRVHRKTHGAIGFADLGKQISRAWKSLDEDGRAKFVIEAQKEKERYQRELKICQANMAASESSVPNPPKSTSNTVAHEVQMNSPSTKRYKSTSFEGGGVQYSYSTHDGSYHGYPHYSPMHSPRGPPPPGYYDHYYGRPPPLPPPHENYIPPPGYGPGPIPPGHYSYYPPPPPDYYYGRPSSSHYGPHSIIVNESLRDDVSPNLNPHHQTPQSFAPPYPSHHYHNYPPRPTPPPPPIHIQHPNVGNESAQMPPSPRDWMVPSRQENPTAECAYQCEVCNNVVFSTFKECADHEEECAKKHANVQLTIPTPTKTDENPDQVKLSPSPSTKKKNAEETEKKATRAAVEAVLLLKTANE